MAETLKIAVAGLGSIGSKVALALDEGVAGLELAAVASSSVNKAKATCAGFRRVPAALPLAELPAAADIVVECLPPTPFQTLADAVLAHPGRTLVVASVGRLIALPGLLERMKDASIRVMAPSGAIAGLDGLRAAHEIGLEEVQLTTRKPPASFGGSIEIDGRSVATSGIAKPLRLFAGSAREAAAAFPTNLNIAATLALAGLGPDATRVEMWVDPSVAVNTHELFVRSRGGELTVTSANLPDEANPRTSAITAFSFVAALRRLGAQLTVGS